MPRGKRRLARIREGASEMGRGWFDFRSGAQRERDYRDFNERVFSGAFPIKEE